ncbi:DNA-directed RNA polymerase sigma-70 factor [Actinomycetota bacterium]|nr:DNA-directed RNA polymerase sigma-70 factor [Actinomycetota bacterium]
MRDDTELPDFELLAKARADPALLGLIYERHSRAVYRFLARRTGTAAAEDLLGEVFVVAVATRLRVQPHESGSALPWLYGIATNITRSYLRRSGARSLAVDVADVDWDAIDARLDAGARRVELREALSALNEGERDVLLLVAWEGLSPTEAAQALGLTPETARKRLQRARARAQASLDQMTPTRR